MATGLTKFEDGSFEKDVLQSTVPVLVDFGAAWCPPCRVIEPHVAALATSHDGRLRVGTVDTEENPEVVRRYGIRGLPTIILFKGGVPVASLVGAVPKSKLEALVAPHL